MTLAKSPKDQFFYPVGRLLSYVALGGTAGYLGEALFTSTSLRSLHLFSSFGMAILLFWMATRVWKKQPFHFSIFPASFLLKLHPGSFKKNGFRSLL